jgi:hypothetical protein
VFAFQLYESTLDLAQALNNGVRPELEDGITYFIYKGEDEVPQIIDHTDFKAYYAVETSKDVLLYKVK